MALNTNEEAGQTPIDPEEMEGLLRKEVDTLAALNDAEALNIDEAQFYYSIISQSPQEIIDEPFVREAHHRMFDRVWSWAGSLRRSDKNLGVAWPEIPVAYRQLRDDTRYWIENATYPADEIAIRYKHRLVSIHLFPNGNGRHSRLMADLLAESLGERRFDWGIALGPAAREHYLRALRAADAGDIGPLLHFARS